MLAISGSLAVTNGDEHIAIVADGAHITARITGGAGGMRRSLTALTSGKPMIRAVAARLNASGVTLTVVRNGTAIAQLGAGTPASVVGRLLDIPHFKIFPRERST
jgi:hypothetical protein